MSLYQELPFRIRTYVVAGATVVVLRLVACLIFCIINIDDSQ